MCALYATVLLNAQGNSYKDIRLTYLWDVTLSMKGYNGSHNIYDKVVSAMIKDIESVTNERTEIVVVPFQNTKYCEMWKEYATPQGIANLKSKIKAYKNTDITNTNISAPLQYAIDEIFTTDDEEHKKIKFKNEQCSSLLWIWRRLIGRFMAMRLRCLTRCRRI